MNISVHVLEKVDIERVAYHVMEVIISVRDQPPLSISMHNSFGWPGYSNMHDALHEFKESH